MTIIASGEAQIDRTDNTVSGVVGTVQIDNLPLNGRNFLDLARLQPGTETVDGATFDPTKANYTASPSADKPVVQPRLRLTAVRS